MSVIGLEPLDAIYSIYKLPLDRGTKVARRPAKTVSAATSSLPSSIADRIAELTELVQLNLESAEAGQVLMLRLNSSRRRCGLDQSPSRESRCSRAREYVARR
jgi:hypothetical protein